MENKNAIAASKLAKIAGILYILIAVCMVTLSMLTSIEFSINGNYSKASLWDFPTHSGVLSMYLGLAFLPFIIGVIGIVVSNKVKQGVTATQAGFLLVAGFLTMIIGVGFLFIIAGIQVLLARKVVELQGR